MSGRILARSTKETLKIGYASARPVIASMTDIQAKRGKQGELMRPIRFRAWNKNAGQMRYDAQNDVVNITDKPELMEAVGGYSHTTFFAIAPHDPNMVFMQFTGLKDRTGKEIYEGDIVLAKNFTPHPLIVKWQDGAFMLVGKHYTGDGISAFSFGTPDVAKQVIGNIYEHKHLLDGLQQEP